jgi:hypothetical protein
MKFGSSDVSKIMFNGQQVSKIMLNGFDILGSSIPDNLIDYNQIYYAAYDNVASVSFVGDNVIITPSATDSRIRIPLVLTAGITIISSISKATNHYTQYMKTSSNSNASPARRW